VWASGRWHTARSDEYVAQVKDYLRRRVWEQPNFVGR
jgi:autotransporter family porin